MKVGLVKVSKKSNGVLFGEQIIPNSLDSIFYWSDVFFGYKNSKIQIFDTLGVALIPDEYSYRSILQLPLVKVEKNEKLGLFDLRSKKLVLPTVYSHIEEYSGRIKAQNADGSYSIIIEKPTGNVSIAGPFDSLDFSYSGYHKFRRNNKWGFLNPKNEIIILDTFDIIYCSYSDYMLVQTNGRFGYIDTTGRLIAFGFETAHNNFQGNLVRVKKDGKWGAIDTKGNTVIPFEFESDSLIFIFGGYYRLKKGGEWGPIYSLDGKVAADLASNFAVSSGNLCSNMNPAYKVIDIGTNMESLIRLCQTPLITISNPQNKTTTLPGPQFPLKACITSNCSVSDISVYVNGQYQASGSAEKDFLVKGSCEGGRYFERLITLPPGAGPHKVVLSVTTPAGTFTAERTVLVGAGVVAETPLGRKPITEKRLALVIGNGIYGGPQNNLPNTSNDADSMQVVLEYLGFKVMKYKNLSLADTDEAVAQFKEAAKGYDVVLVYYSGHGISIKGENYMVPTDLNNLKSETDANYKAYPMERLRGNLDETQVPIKIIVWDACRNTPEGLKSIVSRGATPRGLTSQQNKKINGFFEAYATAMGDIAKDYVVIDGKKSLNSPYTTALLQHLRQPNKSIFDIFAEVRGTLEQLEDNTQYPEFQTNLSKPFYLNPQ